ncbi:MAG TPA: PTS sugar transporter subunit IIA [Gemmatimonadetes bacterium]|nr:PTS sugar transporter subunit IIA [Gemmatimonadota bacterium]
MHDACPPACSGSPTDLTSPSPSVFYRSAMRLREFLRSDFVVLRLEANDIDGVVEEVCACAAAAGIGDAEVIADKLLERERAHSTVIGSGLAIPHATVPGLAEPVIGIAIAGKPIDYGPPGTDPVRLFFVLLSPPGREREHVKLLARICRLARHDDFIDELQSAHDDASVIRSIESVDDRHV